jgi:hypothetical protein
MLFHDSISIPICVVYIFIYIFTRVLASALIFLKYIVMVMCICHDTALLQSCVLLCIQSAIAGVRWIISNQWIVKYLPIAYKWSHHILCNIVLTEKSHGKRVRETLNLIRTKNERKLTAHALVFSHFSVTFLRTLFKHRGHSFCEPRNFPLLAPYFIGPRISCFHFLNNLNCYN